MASAAPGQSGSAAPLALQRGIVKMVLSGCAIIVRGQPRGGPPPERQINLSNIRAGNLARRAAAGQPDAKDTPDEPWGFPAREFLRKKLIGKEVCFTVEYKTPQGREYGMVYLGKVEGIVSRSQLKAVHEWGTKFEPLLPERERKDFKALVDEGATAATGALQATSDTADTAARSMASAISMCRVLWLPLSGLSGEALSLMQDLLFDGKALFADQTNIRLRGIKDSRTTLQTLGLYVPPAKDQAKPQLSAQPARTRYEPPPYKRPRDQKRRSQ